MPGSKPKVTSLAIAAVAIAVASIVGAGGCAHNSAAIPIVTKSPTPIPSGSPTPTPSPTPTANIYVSMDYASMAPTMDPVYGEVDGYAQISPPPTPMPTPSGSPSPTPIPSPTPTETAGPSAIVSVPCNQNIQFLDFDTVQFHTASLLEQVPPGSGFPHVFNNPTGTIPSVQLTPLSVPGFSTGLIGAIAGNPGKSAVYTTGSVDGVYYFGDYTDYGMTPSMRTVIIVSGC
jgi:hypothetical protein